MAAILNSRIDEARALIVLGGDDDAVSRSLRDRQIQGALVRELQRWMTPPAARPQQPPSSSADGDATAAGRASDDGGASDEALRVHVIAYLLGECRSADPSLQARDELLSRRALRFSSRVASDRTRARSVGAIHQCSISRRKRAPAESSRARRPRPRRDGF